MHSMSTPVISLAGLTRRFGQLVAVNNLSLEIFQGEIFGFLGHNGAGKTTTVRLLNGVLEPTSGSARVLGLDPQADGPALRARTGVLTETPSLDERLTARDNLSIYADLYGVPSGEVERRVGELLAEFDLGDRAGEKVGGYSRGMKQRLALARALLHRPELIFLDEPTSGLDPVASRHVQEMILNLARREGGTVFLCTHNLLEAQRICDRVAVLEQGKLVALGTPAELTRQYVRRLEVEIEVSETQVGIVRDLARRFPDMALLDGGRDAGLVRLQVPGREAIPGLLALLVQNGVRIYRAAAQDSNLEEVYFTLHREKEGNA
jgi:ABC-2 type transport system ATP-binding protein